MRQGVTNSDIAEFLAIEAEGCSEPMKTKALRRASRTAFMWPIEAADLLKAGRALTELDGVGPYLSKLIKGWIEADRPAPERPFARAGFMTLTEARGILAKSSKFARGYRGDLQMHSTWSDGSGSILDMAQAAIARGYSYIAITDHSKALKIAGGINEADVAAQADEIAAVNDALRQTGHEFAVLKSIELNLTPTGEGDLDVDCMEKLDLVVGSFHSALRRIPDQTERYLAALENPHVHIMGHPRGRVYNYRPGLNADWPRIFARAAELGKAIEIDSYPDRQDLNLALILEAKKAGCLVAIDTDAHSPDQLWFAEYGLAAAAKAKLDPMKIINFMDVKTLRATFGRS